MQLHRIVCRSFRPLRIAAAVVVFVGGCNSCPPEHKSCRDIPPGAIPQPCGTYMCRWEHSLANGANRDLSVIYHYEWSADPTKLTPRGQEHLYSLARQLCSSPYPIVIETTDDAQMDMARRQAILRSLAEMNALPSADRVVVGRSDAEGLYGPEAVGVAARIIGNQTGAGASGASQGGASGGGQSGSTGSTTSGFGGFGGASAGAGLGMY